MTLRHLCISLAAGALLASCSDADFSPTPTTKGERLEFGVRVDGNWNYAPSHGARPYAMHRAAQFDNSDLWLITTATPKGDTTLFSREAAQSRAAAVSDLKAGYGEFHAYGYVYTAAKNWGSGAEEDAKLYISETVGNLTEKEGGWSALSSCYWPGAAHNLKLFAYASSEATSFDTGTRTLTHSTPALNTAQPDLIVASAAEVPGNHGKAIELNFRHMLSAVTLDLQPGLKGKVTAVGFEGIYTAGSCCVDPILAHAPEAGNTDVVWIGTATGNCCTPDDWEGVSTTGTETSQVEVLRGDQTFMLIPQEFPEGAVMTVSFTDEEGVSHDLRATLRGSWLPGLTYCYSLSLDGIKIEYVVEAECASNEVTYAGGDLAYTVRSYKNITDVNGVSNSYPVPWTLTSEETWLTRSLSGNGSVAGETATIHVDHQTGVTDESHIEALRNAAPVTDYDLSTRGGTVPMTTANCYIVNAPGTYRIPLVYGNGIRNGEVNSSAYTNGTLNGGVLSGETVTFPTHKNQRIVTPYIYENYNFTMSSAKVLWADASNVISNVTLPQDKGQRSSYLQFKVTSVSKDIKPCNAVIALYDNYNEIIWSWHIWVTDYNPYDTSLDQQIVGLANKSTINKNNPIGQRETTANRSLMPCNLGWIPGTVKKYAEREGNLTISINNSDSSKDITITQSEYSEEGYGRNAYYQFGRKDPFAVAYLSGEPQGNDRTINMGRQGLNGDPDLFPHRSNSMTSLDEVTRYPYRVYAQNGQYDWLNITYYDNSNQSYGHSASSTPILNRYLWNMNPVFISKNIDDYSYAVYKTIYDPCPPGFCVPDQYFMYNMIGHWLKSFKSTNIKNWLQNDDLNQVDKEHCWRLGNGSTSEVKFPLNGYINGTDFADTGNSGFVSDMRRILLWTAVPNTYQYYDGSFHSNPAWPECSPEHHGGCIRFEASDAASPYETSYKKGYTSNITGHRKCDLLPVRPMREYIP